MREKIVSWGLVALASIWIFLHRASGAVELQDSDTIALLAGIRARNNPLSWFWTDWPLQNHFYRPIPTLLFELDWRLFGNNGAGFAITNSLIVIAGVIATFLVAKTFFRSQIWGAVAAVLFSLWCTDTFQRLPMEWLYWLPALTVFVFGLLKGVKCMITLLTQCGFATLATSLMLPPQYLVYRCVEWLPGRTATTMTVFAMLSIWCFLEGLDEQKRGWFVGSLIALVLAMASYEQAIMLPPILLILNLVRREPDQKLELKTILIAGALVPLYAVLRRFIMPVTISRYQNQQFRFGAGIWPDLGDYAFVPIRGALQLKTMLPEFPEILLIGETWKLIGVIFISLAGLQWLWRKAPTKEPMAMIAVAFLAYLPMAFLKQFEHYHFFPSALRTLFVIWVLQSVLARISKVTNHAEACVLNEATS